MSNRNAQIAAIIYGELSFKQRELILSLDNEDLKECIEHLRTLHEGHKKLSEDLEKYITSNK